MHRRQWTVGLMMALCTLAAGAETISIRVSGRIETISSPPPDSPFEVGDRWDVTYLVDLDAPDNAGTDTDQFGLFFGHPFVGSIGTNTFATDEPAIFVGNDEEFFGADYVISKWESDEEEVFGYELYFFEIQLFDPTFTAFDNANKLTAEMFDLSLYSERTITAAFRADELQDFYNMRLNILSYEVNPADFVGGAFEGLDARSVACRNTVLDLAVSADNPDIKPRILVDCNALGLDIRAGDPVTVQVRGLDFAKPLVGFGIGMTDVAVKCQNDTTGQVVTGTDGEGGFDCAALGLDLQEFDQVTVTLQGTASRGRALLGQATAFGIDTRLAGCSNLTTGDFQTSDSPEVRLSTTADCEQLGVAVNDGDSLRLQFTGRNFGPRLDGEAAGLSPESIVTCRNGTSGETVSARLDTDLAWDCVAQGLTLQNGDQVVVTIGGPAAAP